MRETKILLVDDDPLEREDLKSILEQKYNILEARSGEEALEIINTHPIDVVILDIWLGKGQNGVETLRKIRFMDPDVEVVIVTSDSSPYIINQCVEMDVHNYLKKPIKEDDLLITVHISAQLRKRNLEYRIKDQLLKQANNNQNGMILGESPKVKKVIESVYRVAAHHETSILITGESGTGKEMVARAINKSFGDPKRPFIAINCAAISPTLIESELFGHEKGAFTGAYTRKVGCFELANGGDIFLDEIVELPTACQAKLLRVLQEKEFTRVGGTQPIQSNFRLISATNKSIPRLIDMGKFREDLYYRINVYNINMPPLRERIDDIPVLVSGLLKTTAKKLHKYVRKCDSKVLEHFKNQEWKGNIRALKNVLEIMVINTKNEVLDMDDLPPSVSFNKSLDSVEFSFVKNLYNKCNQIGVHKSFDDLEKNLLKYALNNNKNMSKAAKAIGLSKGNMSLKAKKYGIPIT